MSYEGWLRHLLIVCTSNRHILTVKYAIFSDVYVNQTVLKNPLRRCVIWNLWAMLKCHKQGKPEGKTPWFTYHQVLWKDDMLMKPPPPSAWKFDFVFVDKLDRPAIIDAIIATEYSKSDELALINNKDLTKQGEDEYSKYQAFRAQAKAWADELNW